jgi:hypothetical protein
VAKPLGKAEAKPTELRTIETRVIETKPSPALVTEDTEVATSAS